MYVGLSHVRACVRVCVLCDKCVCFYVCMTIHVQINAYKSIHKRTFYDSWLNCSVADGRQRCAFLPSPPPPPPSCRHRHRRRILFHWILDKSRKTYQPTYVCMCVRMCRSAHGKYAHTNCVLVVWLFKFVWSSFHYHTEIYLNTFIAHVHIAV